jgi:xanthine dehydrogenase YagS FAD-binding subunit
VSFYFEKVADRNVWDFPLVNVAAAFRMNGSTVADARIVCGAVQCTPRRVTAAERLLRGRARTEQVAEAAGAAAVAGAEPLAFNQFKVPLMQSLVKRAVRGA